MRGGSRTKRVTSVDVARQAGVSQATVARSFSSPELVSPATQARVRAAANELGYVPNAIARSLKSQRTNMIGAVVPAHGEYWQNILTAFSRQLAQRQKQLLLFSFSDPSGIDDVLASVAQYRLDGLILASASIRQPQFARVQTNDVPIVAFNQPAAAGVVPSVSINNESGMAALAEHVVEQGCRSVLFVGGISAVSTDQQRYRGAAQTLGAHGVPCAYIEAGSFSYDDGYKAAQLIVDNASASRAGTYETQPPGSVSASNEPKGRLPGLPDAVMVAGDELAFGVIDGLARAGLSTPDDVLVTGFDGLPQANWAGYDLTTLAQDTDVMVERAIELLNDPQPASKMPNVVVAGSIRFGKTTRGKSNG